MFPVVEVWSWAEAFPNKKVGGAPVNLVRSSDFSSFHGCVSGSNLVSVICFSHFSTVQTTVVFEDVLSPKTPEYFSKTDARLGTL